MPFTGDTHSFAASPYTSNGSLSDAEVQHNAPLADISSSLTVAKFATSSLGARDIATLALLIASTTYSYTAGPGLFLVVPGDIIRTRRENFSYEVAASAAVDHHIATASGVKLYVLPSAQGTASVLQFGVVMGGIVDDLMPLQKAFTYSSTTGVPLTMPAGVVAVSDSIYAWSKFTFKGKGIRSSTVRLTALPTVPGGEELSRYWFVLGAASRGGAGQVWTGSMSDVEFDVPATLPSQINTAVYVGSHNGSTLDRVRVNTNGKVANNGIGRKNNSIIVTGPITKNFFSTNCEIGGTMLADGEPFGIASIDGFEINGLRVYGEAGDDVGVHVCKNGVFNDLYMESAEGRVYIADSKRIALNNPRIEYVNPAVAVGMGFVIQSESIAVPDFCDGITINGGSVKYRTGVTGPNYGARITGRNIIINNLLLIKEDATQVARCVVENQVLAGWVDPSGIDAAGVPRNHNVLINGMNADDITLTGTGTNVSIVNSTSRFFYMTGTSLETWDNNKSTGTLTDNLFSAEEGQVKASKLLFTCYIANAGAAYVTGREQPNLGSTLHRVKRSVAITHLVISSDTAITAGFYQFRLVKNGVSVNTATATYAPADGDQAERIIINPSTEKDYFAARGDTIGVQAKTDAGTPTPQPMLMVKVYGLEL